MLTSPDGCAPAPAPGPAQADGGGPGSDPHPCGKWTECAKPACESNWVNWDGTTPVSSDCAAPGNPPSCSGEGGCPSDPADAVTDAVTKQTCGEKTTNSTQRDASNWCTRKDKVPDPGHATTQCRQRNCSFRRDGGTCCRDPEPAGRNNSGDNPSDSPSRIM